jgi:hypothetical protein
VCASHDSCAQRQQHKPTNNTQTTQTNKQTKQKQTSALIKLWPKLYHDSCAQQQLLQQQQQQHKQTNNKHTKQINQQTRNKPVQ